MFSYIPKSMWFPTSVDVEQAATIEALLKLCKDGEVERVIIPHTYYGYGATVIDSSNLRSIQQHYSRARFKTYAYALTMSASQFTRNEHYREMIEELTEQDPIFNDQDYSELEHEILQEHIVIELTYALNKGEVEDLWTNEEVQEILDSRDSDRIEWWEYVELDTDGATPYAKESDVQELAQRLKALRRTK